jgi:hypothetical protein
VIFFANPRTNMEPRTMWAAGGQPQAAPHYTDAQRAARAARAAACPVARGQPDRSEYDEWGRHKDYVEPVESDDGLGASIHGSTDEAGQWDLEDDDSSFEIPPSPSSDEAEAVAPQQPQRRMPGTPPPELTEEQLTARLREFDEWGRVRGQAARQPTDDGLGGSIKGSTVDILGENWREQEQTPIPKHEPVAKERPIRRLCNPQSARDELESIMDGRIYHLDFPETPMRYVGMTASCVTAIRDEPGRTLIRQYMMPRLKNQRGNPLARVDTEAGFVARFLFEEDPKAAKKRLVEFLEETCDGEHDVPEVTEIIKQFEPFDIKLSTLVRMLDAIFEQGNTHAAQICQLRTDNRKQASLISNQEERLLAVLERNDNQEKQLSSQEKQLCSQQEQLSRQGDKLDQLLAIFQPIDGPPRSESEGSAPEAGKLANSPAKKKLRGCERELRTKASAADNAKRDAERHAMREATLRTLLEHFVIGEHNGVLAHESVTSDDIMQACSHSNPQISANALGRGLKQLGADKKRQAEGTAYFYVRHI